MTTRESDNERRRVEATKELYERLRREEAGEFQRSNTDPEFTAEELARIHGLPRRRVLELLQAANVGTYALRRDSRGVMQRTRIVRWSQLKNLKDEFGW